MTLIEDLLDLQVPQSVKLSPNGQEVIWSTSLTFGHKTGEHEQSTIWLADTGKQHSARQLTTGNYNDHDPKWSPDGQYIAFVSDRGKQDESSALYLMSTTGPGEPLPLTPAGNERVITKFDFSPEGRFIAFLSADEKTEEKKKREKEKDDVQVWGEEWAFNRLRLVDVASKEITTLVGKDSHILDFVWDDKGTRIAFTETKTPHIESYYLSGTTFHVFDCKTKETMKVSHFPQRIWAVQWGGESLLHFIGPVAETIQTSSNMVYTVKVGAAETQYEKHAYGETNCAMQLVKAGGDVMVLVQEGMQDQIRVLDGHTLYGKKRKLDVWDAAFTKDSDEVVLAIAQGDTNHPTEVFTTTASGGALVQLSSHGKPLADRTFGSCTFLSCPSLDGTDGKPTTPLPTAVLIHGGPYSRHTEAFDALYFMWTPPLLAAGYAILLVDYRGSSGRGETWASYAYGSSGTYDYDDVIAQTQHAISAGYADKERLVVGGYSQGGFLSYLASVRNGTHGLGWDFKASIPGAGVSDLATMTLTSDIGFWQAETCGGAPWTQSKFNTSSRQGSAIWEFADAVKEGVKIPPMLILHGEKDERVPIEQASGMRRAMEQAGLVFSYVTYPREGHFVRERKHLVDMAERVKGWTDKYIGDK